ncbi:MAG: carboxypeptidase regulatory-like domain-containing protein, partial [Pyrinomonadaceae bacterium]
MKRAKFVRHCVQLLLCGVLPVLIFSVVSAQTGTSNVSGTVSDAQGNVVSGASVKLISVGTNATRNQATNENGVYNFDLIPPGEYRLEIEAAGFKKAVVPDVRALVAKGTELNVTLEVGNIAESVTVSASSAEELLNVRDATIGNNFVSQQILQLPLESRNVVELLSLQPGVTPSGYVTGSRADQANVTLDGVDVNEQQTGLDIVADLAFNEQQAFASVLRSTPDSIQEFRVTTTTPNATQGRSSGGQVSLITKSGT